MLILYGFVVSRIGINRDPPRDWPARLVCETFVGFFGVSGLAFVVAGISYVIKDAATVNRVIAPLVRKALLWGASFFVASLAAIAIYFIWPAVVR